jgi:hypothetical protein
VINGLAAAPAGSIWAVSSGGLGGGLDRITLE